MHINNVGKAEKIALISMSLPSAEIIVEHPDSLLSIFCIIGRKFSIFGFPLHIGSPKYVNGKELSWQLRVLVIV